MHFPGFYGNPEAKARVSRMLAENRVPQAILIEGDRGCGKRTFARIIAQALVCRAEGERPCGVCPQCQKAKSDTHPDFLTLEGGEALRSFGVEKIRSLRNEANIRPNEAPCKIYFLFRAHTMTDQAQNALLKILEEPPGPACFLLTCESAQQMLSTIVSRCVVLSLIGVSEAEACEAASALCPKASPYELAQAAHLWDGNIGRMVETLSGGTLTRASEIAEQISQAMFSRDETAILTATAPLCRDRDLFRSVFGILSMRFLDAIQGNTALFSVPISRSRLLYLYDATRECISAADRYTNQPLLVTYACSLLKSPE